MTSSLHARLLLSLLALSAACSDDANTNNAPGGADMNTASNTAVGLADMASTKVDMSVAAVDMKAQPMLDMRQAGVDMARTTVDMAQPQDLSMAADMNVVPDARDTCDEKAKITAAWPLYDRVAATDILVTQDASGVFSGSVDASAGGFGQSNQNPFVYLDLDTGTKVAVSDTVAITSETTWEVAFRRTEAFVNGGDAGPGSVEVAKLVGADYDTVTVADLPTSGSFVTEDPVSPACTINAPAGGIGVVESVFERLTNPTTNSGSWYDYSMSGMTPAVSPVKGDVYIFQKTDQNKRYKFEIQQWSAGVYTLRWEAI